MGLLGVEARGMKEQSVKVATGPEGEVGVGKREYMAKAAPEGPGNPEGNKKI